MFDIKKALLFLVAGATLVYNMSVVNAIAFDGRAFTTWYSTADINRNGTVDITDNTILGNVLWGSRYIASNSHMDADGNNVISSADSHFILSKASGVS